MACHCDDFSRAQAGRGLRGIEPGMPTPAGTGLSRRSFLARGSGLALSVFGGSLLSSMAFEEGIAKAQGAAASPVLVSIFLSGGLDSLSMLAPVGDARYAALRPNLRLTPSGNAADVFSEDDRLHWHPSAAPLRDLHLAGKVSVMPAIGYGDPNQSHFTSRHYWEVGSSTRSAASAGSGATSTSTAPTTTRSRGSRSTGASRPRWRRPTSRSRRSRTPSTSRSAPATCGTAASAPG